MMAIGSYFAFIILVSGTLLSAQEISDEERQQFINDVLEEHNKKRELYGSLPLELDEELCIEAQKYVDMWSDTKDADKNILRITRIPDKYGYNAFSMKINDHYKIDAKFIMWQWYQYEGIYDYNEKLTSNKLQNPFTRIVWKSTKQLGVGISLTNNVFRVLIFYSPPGNQIGESSSNVAMKKTERNETTGE